jgi:RecJ-like exonuclease
VSDVREALLQELMRGAQPEALREAIADLNPDELKRLWVAADLLQQQLGEIEGSETCPECEGKGVDEDGEDCPHCNGEGLMKGEKDKSGYDRPGSLEEVMKRPSDKPGKLGKMKNMILLISANKKKSKEE